MRNFYDQVLPFNFVLAHVPGSENPATDYTSQLEISPTDISFKIELLTPDSLHRGWLAWQTLKQNNDEKIFHSDGIPSSGTAAPSQPNEEDVNIVLRMVTQPGGQSKDDYEQHPKLIRNQIIQNDEHASSDVEHYTQLHSWSLTKSPNASCNFDITE